MKSVTIITLIICGTVLVATPYIHTNIATGQVTNTMIALGKDVDLTTRLPEHADVICMFGGFLMILAGTIAGFRSK